MKLYLDTLHCLQIYCVAVIFICVLLTWNVEGQYLCRLPDLTIHKELQNYISWKRNLQVWRSFNCLGLTALYLLSLTLFWNKFKFKDHLAKLNYFGLIVLDAIFPACSSMIIMTLLWELKTSIGSQPFSSVFF